MIRYLFFCVWLLLFNIISVRVIFVVSVHYFSLLCCIPLFGYTTFYSFYSAWAFGLFPRLGYYDKSAMNIPTHVFGRHKHLIYWVVAKGRILSHRVYSHLTLVSTIKHFSVVVGLIHITIVNVKFQLLRSFQYLICGIVSLLILVIPVGVVVIAHFGFNIHFSDT